MPSPPPSTPAPGDETTDAACGHVDTDLLRQWTGALARWDTQGYGATSAVTGGGAVEALEAQWSRLVDGRPCLAVGSGSAALVVALAAVGVGAGDDVIVPGLDWTAAYEAVRLLGATPLLADVDPATGTISCASAARLRTGATRAAVATHLFGIPADVPGLRDALGPGVPVVEDCAQAVGARLDVRPVGCLGDAAAFSLGPGKHIDAGEGGVVVFADEQTAARGVAISQHPVRRLRSGAPPGTPVQLSSRVHPFAAVLAWSLLQDLPAATAARLRRVAAIRAELTGRPGLHVLEPGPRGQSAWWRVPLLVQPGASPPPGWAPATIPLPHAAAPPAPPAAADLSARLYWQDPAAADPPVNRAAR